MTTSVFTIPQACLYNNNNNNNQINSKLLLLLLLLFWFSVHQKIFIVK